jgi:acetate kinase
MKHAEKPGAQDYVLAFNAGSSSLKFELFRTLPDWSPCVRGVVRDIGRARPVIQIEGSDPEPGNGISGHAEAARWILERIFDSTDPDRISGDRIAASGHRVVHGGEMFLAPTAVDASVMQRLRSLIPLAPLHNPLSLAVMDVVSERLPGVPRVAVFDTAFFRPLPDVAKRYAVPAAWYNDFGVQRFGFHGISHEYMLKRSTLLGGRIGPAQRVVSLHLGQGCSVSALRNGQPVETSMGFTPLEGLIMGTRSGDLDAGVVLHMASRGRSWRELDDELNRKSGLLGLSGASDDVRELIDLEREGHAGAKLALDAFCHRIRKYIGSYAAVLGGLDAILIGGGIGENAPSIRSRILSGFGWLGLKIDEKANARCVGCEGPISMPSSAIGVGIIAVREEEAIARAAVDCMASKAMPEHD